MHLPNKFSYFISVLKRDPFELIRIFQIAWNTFNYRYIRRCTGKGTVIGIGNKIINSANVYIGAGCLLQDSIYIRAGIEGKIIIRDRVALNSFCQLFGHGSIEIGEDTQIGPGTIITTTGHDYRHNLKANFKKIVIGKGVWIGANATILPGVEIGDYVVIGAGAVVNKNIPENTLAAGVPARIIKKLKYSTDLSQKNGNYLNKI